jgi:hypothetical protein
MPGQVPLQRKPAPGRDPADGHAAAHGLNDAPRVAQLARVGRMLNDRPLRQARVSAPVIQGYSLENSSGGAATLHSHAPEPVLEGTTVRHPAQQRAAKGAQFRLSDDRSIAVHNTTNEPKEFFAKNSVFVASNTALTAAGSDVRLRKVGAKAYFGNDQLAAIGPARVNAEPVLEGFQQLWSHICISLTSKLMGNPQGTSHEQVVLEDAASGNRSGFAIEPTGQTAPEISRLAENLTNSPADPHAPQARLEAARVHATTAPNATVGRPYGLASHAGTIDAGAQQLGVNQYARPEVGEGFATFTIAPGGSKPLDFASTGRAVKRGNSWGYHHAAVVARSTDGRDWVTLENYNRDPQARDKLLPLVYERYRKAAVRKANNLQKRAKEQKRPPLSEEAVQAAVAQYLTTENPHAAAYLNELSMAQSNATKNSLWFFRMYGSGPGQSFHEEQAASGAYLNPLTVRIRHDPLRKPRATLNTFRTGIVEKLGQVTWPAGRTPLSGLATGVHGLIAQIDAAPPGRTNQQARDLLGNVRGAYAAWLTAHFVPRLVQALNGTRRGVTATATTLAQLRDQSQEAEPPPGKKARLGNYLGSFLYGEDLYNASRTTSVSRLRALVTSAPQEL